MSDGQPLNNNLHDKNNFDFLRLLAASLVILSHSFVFIYGIETMEPLYRLTGDMTLGRLGVVIFFVISGYLIAKSWHNKPVVSKFLWNRILRLVPGLIVLSVITIFVIGPMVTSLPLGEYFGSALTWSYFRIATVFGITNMPFPELPGIFVSNPYPGVMNGSLWTLDIEFRMYLIVLMFGLIGLFRDRRVLLAMVTLSLLIFAYTSGAMLFLAPIVKALGYFGLASFVSFFTASSSGSDYVLALYFLIGCTYYLYSSRVKFDLRIAMAGFVFWAFTIGSTFFGLASLLILPYVILSIASANIPLINNAAKYGDFSYGLYIYAFPIQQSIVYFAGAIGVIPLFLLSLACVLPVSIASWHLVESKALRLKNIDFRELIVKTIGADRNQRLAQYFYGLLSH